MVKYHHPNVEADYQDFLVWIFSGVIGFIVLYGLSKIMVTPHYYSFDLFVLCLIETIKINTNKN
jgi:hypothetical protein